ncbi:MAG: hypothetical protein KJ056_12800 [Acidimicrobiia bacterium]|nr:hypothetical protein [Acidimicrobiia bacterium]
MIVDEEADAVARQALDAGVPEDEVLAMLVVAYEAIGMSAEYARFVLDMLAGRAHPERWGPLE